ncbi:conserved hypothetical protein [Gammaproteobacteria bacterium]
MLVRSIISIISQQNQYVIIGVWGMMVLLLVLVFGFFGGNLPVGNHAEIQHIETPHDGIPVAPQHSVAGAPAHHGGGEGEEGEETPPETFVILDFFSEALEASVAGIGVKIVELKPKVEHVNEMYNHGEKHKAFAKSLGIATEVVMMGFFLETFGIGEMFISALSFQDNWLASFAGSAIGVMSSTKAALLLGEKVEEAAEHQYEHDVHIEEALAKTDHPAGTSSHGAH